MADATTIFRLERPEYLSDGETGIIAYKDNFTKIDNMLSCLAVDRVTGVIITNRINGDLAISRIAAGG